MPSKPLQPCRHCKTPTPSMSINPTCPACVKGRKRVAARVYDNHRRPPQERGYDYEWVVLRNAHFKANQSCEACGAPATIVDHIVPLRVTGDHQASGLMSMCDGCHARKSAVDKLKARGRYSSHAQ